jgi:hypothetical protein
VHAIGLAIAEPVRGIVLGLPGEASPVLAMARQRARPASVVAPAEGIWVAVVGPEQAVPVVVEVAVPLVVAEAAVAVVAEAVEVAVAVVNPPLPCSAYLYLRRIR